MNIVNFPSLEIIPLSEQKIETASTFLFNNWHAHYRQELPSAVIEQRTRGFFRQQLHRKLSTSWLAVFGSRIVGLVTVTANCIDDIWVEAEYQRRQIGRNLLATALAHIKNRGYLTAQVGLEDFNEACQHFFLSTGWQQIGSDHIHLATDTWVQALVFSKRI